MINRREAGNPQMRSNDETGRAGGDEIAAYLEELHHRLTNGMVRTSAGHADQIVEEAENHLREGAAMCVAAGMREHAAQVAAVEAFGPARTVARAHRPRTAAVLAKLAESACPLLGVYVVFAYALAGAFILWENQNVAPAVPSIPLGHTGAAPITSAGFPFGLAALLLAVCALAGLAALAGYLIIRRRRHSSARAASAVPLPGFFFPAAGVGMALLALAERKAAARAPLYTLPGGHEFIAMGAPAAAILTAVACGGWTLMLLVRWAVNRLAGRPSATVRA
jgi:hypothetical protein